MVEIRWLKNWESRKIGDTSSAGPRSAGNFVSQGYAEYVEKPKNSCANVASEKEEIKTPLPKKQPIDFKIKQFEKFYYFLTKDAPEGYKPWFFPCEKIGKNPCAYQIIKIAPQKSLCCNSDWVLRVTKEEEKRNKEIEKKEDKIKPKWMCDKCEKAKGSWHSLHARLNKEQCIQHIQEGYNLGISARKDDPLIIGDIDVPEFIKQAPKNTLTSTSRKRGGIHFFGWDKDGSAKINLPTDEGEIRSDNQYVIAPGSYVPFDLKNKKDKKAFDELPKEAREDELIGYYTFRDAFSPKEMVFNDFPEFFKKKEEENIEAEARLKNREDKKEFQGEGKYSELFKLKVSDIVGLIPANKRQGHPLHESDTDANFSLSKDGSICHCWRHLVSLNVVQYLCVKTGYSKCEDAGTPHKGRGLSKIKGDKKAFEVAYKEAIKLKLIKKYEGKSENEFLIAKGRNKKTGKMEFGVDIDKVADHLISKFNFKTIYGQRSETIWVYEDGIYHLGARGIIKSECEEILGGYARKNPVEEILDKIKRKTKTNLEEFHIIKEGFVCLENGVFDLKKQKFIEHSPDFYFKSKIPIYFNKEKDCPNIKKFFTDILYKEDINLIQEWFGFNIYNRYFEKRATIFYGEKDTGKTIALNLLTSFVGEKNTTSLSLQNISYGKSFDLLCLKDKHSNIYDDLGDKDIKDTGGFKIATGGGYITGEEKFGDRIDFKTFAKLTFATNKIPPVEDVNDDAYYSRWIPIAFDNQIPKKDQDKDILKKLTTKEEMSGLFNWALKGFKRLIKNNGFSFNKTGEEIKHIMQRSSHPLAKFGQDCLIQSDGEKISKEHMFLVYLEWCKITKTQRMSKDKLGKNLEKFVPFIIANRSKDRFWENGKFSMLPLKVDTKDTFLKILRTILKSNNKGNNKGNNNGVINGIYSFEKGVLPVNKKKVKNTQKTEDLTEEELMEKVVIDYKK